VTQVASYVTSRFAMCWVHISSNYHVCSYIKVLHAVLYFFPIPTLSQSSRSVSPVLATTALILIHTSHHMTGVGVAQSVLCLTTDWTAGVRSPAEANGSSSSVCVPTNFETHQAFYPMDNAGPFRGLKLGRGVKLTTHPISCRGKERVADSCLGPSWCLHGASGGLYFTSHTV
jgi:hypothetical protein